ncbi:MAG: hypothetical protein RPR40_01290 [Bermanella sp.]
MKYLLFLLWALSASQSGQAAQFLDLAIETNGIRVEYIESSQRGIVYVKDCSQCTKDYYTFTSKPVIKRGGKVIDFPVFLSDYWNAKYPTLFLDPKTLSVLRINY